MKYTVGIIGNGRFGDMLYKTFNRYSDFNVKMYSRRETSDQAKFFSLEKVCKTDILVPSVPISVFESQIENIADLIGPGTLVVDVCSVSVYPENVLKKYLKPDIDILSTHPMFGPDSTKDATFFDNLKFVFHYSRISDTRKVQIFLKFWEGLGCEMVEMIPDEHDKQAAYTHAYAFLIGKIGIKLNVRRNAISTKGFEGILYNQEAVENDTGQLFEDMMKFNPYAKEMRQKMLNAINEIEEELETKNPKP